MPSFHSHTRSQLAPYLPAACYGPYTPGVVAATQHFGAEQFLGIECEATISVVAVEFCQVAVLRRSHINDVLVKYPRLETKMAVYVQLQFEIATNVVFKRCRVLGSEKLKSPQTPENELSARRCRRAP